MVHIQRRPSGIYVARLAVPARLQAIVGAREFLASTGSREPSMAKLIAAAKIAFWRQQLLDIEHLSQAPYRSSMAHMENHGLLRIAQGHPSLRGGGYLPLVQAALDAGLEFLVCVRPTHIDRCKAILVSDQG